jgi:hypothetical protein
MSPEETKMMLADLAAKYPEVDFYNSRRNARLLVEWLNKNAPGSVLCPELTDLAARYLRERLDRLPPPPPPPAPLVEEEPAEILESWQLPLDCSVEDQRRATKEQLQDLIQRHGGKIGIL